MVSSYLNVESSAEFQRAREFFINPRQPETSDELGGLALQAVKIMAEIYAGNIEWLGALSEDGDHHPEIETVLLELLKRESITRKFDHNFMGQIHPQGNKIGIVANLIAAYMNTNTIVREVSPSESIMEQEVLAHMGKWFGYDRNQMSGNITSGGSNANLAAMWVARERALAGLAPHLRRKAQLYVFGSGMAHYSVTKDSDILGNQVHFVKVPQTGFKTDAAKMREYLDYLSKNPFDRDGNPRVPMSIIGLAGETETGLVDNLEELAELAQQYGAHFHVDAAYGGPFAISSQGHRFDGIQAAGSITIDPHKLIYTPYSAGAVLFRDGRDHLFIEKGMKSHARYLLKDKEMHGETPSMRERNFGLSRVEGSMGAGGVLSTWATLRTLGDRGLAALLDHTIELTCHAHEQLQCSPVLRPLFEPELNTILIGLRDGVVDPLKYNLTINTIQREADKRGVYVSSNGEVDHGRTALRMVPMHPHTGIEDINNAIAVLEEEAMKCQASR